MKRTDMKMRTSRVAMFLNLMNEVIRRGDKLYVHERAKQCGVAPAYFYKARQIGVFPTDVAGGLLPRKHAVYAPTAKLVIRAVDGYMEGVNKKYREKKSVSSPAPVQQPALDFTAPTPEPLSSKPPVSDKITDTINRLRDAGVKSAVMFVVEL
jgi:hypothetical protein